MVAISGGGCGGTVVGLRSGYGTATREAEPAATVTAGVAAAVTAEAAVVVAASARRQAGEEGGGASDGGSGGGGGGSGGDVAMTVAGRWRAWWRRG